jgi:hypothetical protein
MSDREKKLVLLFGLAAFLLVNFFAFTWVRDRKAILARQLIDAEGKVTMAEVTADSYETVIEEMDWLDQRTPEPRAGDLVGTDLETYAANQATTNQLTIKRRAIKPNDESGVHFHRAKVEFNVTGTERGLYSWLSRLQMPDQFRAVTFMRVAPDAKDDTLIEATVEVEQWYVPLVEDDAAAPVDAAVEGDATPPEPPSPGDVPAPAPEATPPGVESPPAAEGSPLPPEALNPPGTE